MKFVDYQDCKSPHQLPLARKLAALIGGGFCYVFRDQDQPERADLGWGMASERSSWMKWAGETGARNLIEESDVLLTGFRDCDLLERRSAEGRTTFYQFERWFKPLRFGVDGVVRLLHPGYRRMARRVVACIDRGRVWLLPMGVHAARDMVRLMGIMHGDWRCWFGAPQLDFERFPLGKCSVKSACRKAKSDGMAQYDAGRMRLWGYFVDKGEGRSRFGGARVARSSLLRVLWVGRFLRWKRVDTIIRAIGHLIDIHGVGVTDRILVDIYGAGPEEPHLRNLVESLGCDRCFSFHAPVAIGEVRGLMRGHDVYVLSSSAYEGWGAAVSEALEEGMTVFGTFEAGASATMLPEEDLFHAGDWRRLAGLLQKFMDGEFKDEGSKPFVWTAENAAQGLVRLVTEVN